MTVSLWDGDLGDESTKSKIKNITETEEVILRDL